MEAICHKKRHLWCTEAEPGHRHAPKSVLFHLKNIEAVYSQDTLSPDNGGSHLCDENLGRQISVVATTPGGSHNFIVRNLRSAKGAHQLHC